MLSSVPSRFRALVVDDDDLCRDVIVSMLRRLGASEVVQLADGASALAWADTDKHELDLIVCDLRMPQVDGIETLDGLALRTAPAVFVLASAADPRLLRAATAAAASKIEKLLVVEKPITFEKMELIVAAISQWLPPSEQEPKVGVYTPADCSTKIVRGMINGEFVSYYEPKLQIDRNRVCGMEAHLRWLSPHGLLEPESFLEIARSTNLLDDLFFAVLPAAATDCAAWRRNDYDVAVTLSLPVALLTARDLPARLEDLVTMNGLAPRNMTLEVTVDAWLHENQIAREVLTRLRIRGFGLSVADFGRGYSTIKHLLDSPFNEMKIGRAFVRAAPTDPEAAIALYSCIALAHQLGMTAVAEGVETPAQLGFITGAKCDQVQGPIVARPMPGDELAQWLSMRGSKIEIAEAILDDVVLPASALMAVSSASAQETAKAEIQRAGIATPTTRNGAAG